MLEQSANDRDDAHVFRGALDARDQAADAAYEQRDANAGVRCLGYLLDDFLVRDGIRLHERAGGKAGTCPPDLRIEVVHEHRLDLQGGDAQHVVVVGDVFELHVAEELDGIASERLIDGDEREVGVESGRFLVVVAGAQLRDVLDGPIGRAPCDAANLRVHLVVPEAVQHVATGLLETLGPFDVVVLVEPCAQLEEGRDLFAGVGGRDQRLGEMRLARKAVQRDLDGDDAGVGDCLAEELDEWIHALVRVREQDVAFLHLVDDGPFPVEAGRPCRREGRIRQPSPLRIGQTRSQAPREAEVERHGGVVHLAAFQPELLQHELFHDGGKRTLAFEADGSEARTLFQQALHVLAVVLVLLVARLVGVDVGVARDADDIRVLDLVHAEDFRNEHLQGMLEQDELEAAPGKLDDALALVGQGDKPQDHAFSAALVLLFLRLVLLLFLAFFLVCLVVEPDQDVQLPVFQVGERVARVYDLRRQERLDIVFHEPEQVVALFFGKVVGAQVTHAFLGKLAANVLVSGFLDGVQLVAAFVDGFDLGVGGHAGLRVDHRRLDVGQVCEAADAHHEEFLEVAPENGYEIQSLEQRHRFVGTLVEHALVEGEPGELAVLHVGETAFAIEFRLLVFFVLYVVDGNVVFVFGRIGIGRLLGCGQGSVWLSGVLCGVRADGVAGFTHAMPLLSIVDEKGFLYYTASRVVVGVSSGRLIERKHHARTGRFHC